MKTRLPMAALAMCAGLLGAGGALAQTNMIVEPVITVGSDQPSAQSPAAARKEAAAAWAQAQQDCRKSSSHDARSQCLSDARADHDQMMASLRNSS